MKNLLSTICLTACIFSSISVSAAVDVSGTYRLKECDTLKVGKGFTAPALATEIMTSESFEITQSNDEITIDGDSTYWNYAPAIYLTSQSKGEEQIRIKSLKSNDSTLSAKYTIKSGIGINKNTEIYSISLQRKPNGVVHFEMVAKYRNILTFGFNKKNHRYFL